jgi:hypothetical protein
LNHKLALVEQSGKGPSRSADIASQLEAVNATLSHVSQNQLYGLLQRPVFVGPHKIDHLMPSLDLR